MTGWYLVFDVATHQYISYLTLICIHRYLPCYTYYLISDTGTCHAILITWYLTPVLAMLHLTLDILPPGTNTLDLILWHLTGYYYTGHRTSLHTHDYHFMGTWLLYCYQTFGTPVLLNSCIPEPLKKGDSWYYTSVDPRNRITMNIWLLWTPCGYYHWIILIIRQLTLGWRKLMSTDIVLMFMMVL